MLLKATVTEEDMLKMGGRVGEISWDMIIGLGRY